jgi:restriction endonuclease S subunit
LIFGDDKMAVFSIVKLSELEGTKRLDAEYYKPEYLEVKQKLLQTEFVYFRDLVKEIIHPKEIKREYEEEKQDYLFLLAQNVRPLMLDLSERKYISEEKAKQMPKNLLEKGDILFIRTGAVGDSTVYIGKPQKVIASAHILIAKPNFKVSPYYLSVFFNTSIGKNLIIRGTYGALQPEIAPNYIKNLPVPIFSRDLIIKIEELFLKSQDLLQESQNLYSQAETLLLEELGLKDFKPKYEKTYTAKLSSAFSAHRIDAEYFQPAYEEVIEKLRENNIELKPLRKFILSIQKGIEPGSENYRDEGKPFIRVSNLSISGFIDRDQKYLNEELYHQLRETYEPKQGDFLLTKDATPGIAYVVKEQIEGIISSGILRLQINDSEINKEYLALCINSLVGRMQIERDCGGSVILHWKPEQVKRLKIPILPFPTQQKIASLVQQSHEARKKAKELLEVAKKAVEIAIEKNEKEALDYILKTFYK